MMRLVVIWLFFSVLILVGVNWGFPLLTYDTQCFLPAAIEFKMGLGLTNHIYNPINDELNRFLYYPPGYPIIMSYLSFGDSWESVFLGIGVVSIVNLLLSLFVLSEIFHNFSKQLKWFDLALLAISVISFNPLNGSRPELLIQTIYWIWIAFNFTHNRTNVKVLLGLLLVMISFWVSVVGGLYFLILFTLYLVYFDWVIHLKNWVVFLVVGGFLGVMVYAYPFSIELLIQGIIKHAKNVVVNRQIINSPFDFLRYYVFNLNGSFLVLLMIISVCFGYSTLVKVQKNRGLLFTLLIALLFFVSYFGLGGFQMSYNVSVLYPFMITTLFYLYVQGRVKLLLFRSILLITGLPFLYYTEAFISCPAEKLISLESVKKTVVELKKPNTTFGLTSAYWPLIYESDNLKCCRLYDGKSLDYDYLLIQQYGSGLESPENIMGYKLVENGNGFYKKNSTILGYPKFYQFALYKRSK
jgi:hypothetical protein